MKLSFEGIDLHGIVPVMDKDFSYADIDLPNAIITITVRPYYCDRGRYGFMVNGKPGQEKFEIDWADGFPRYFFSLQRAMDEIHDWIVFNKVMYPKKFEVG